MNSWKILVVDDNTGINCDKSAGSRFVKYSKLEDQTYDAHKFSLTFADDPENARKMLDTGSFDIVLLDVRLELGIWGDDPQGTLFKELFEKASNRCVVALVSSEWDNTSMGLVREFLLNRPKLQLPLFFTFRDFEGEKFAAISVQLVSYIKKTRSMHSLSNIEQNSPLFLLHISDLHFGAGDTLETLASEAKQQRLFDEIKKEWKDGPHFIVVTGDIGNTGHPEDYEKALVWFEALAKAFKWTLPSPRIMLVPGNHDFCIPLSGAQSSSLNADKKLEFGIPTEKNKCLTSYAMQPFKEFALKVSMTNGAWDSSPVLSWTEFGFAEYGVVFSGFNTSKVARDDSWPEKFICENDIRKVINEFNAEPKVQKNKGLLHISLSHHCPTGQGGADEPIKNKSDYIEYFLGSDHAPQLLLHGHVHVRRGSITDDRMIISAPTPTKSPSGRPADTSRGVNLITLERKNSIVNTISARSLAKADGGWIVSNLPNKASHKLGRSVRKSKKN